MGTDLSHMVMRALLKLRDNGVRIVQLDDLKEYCDLPDRDLLRELRVLEDQGFVELLDGYVCENEDPFDGDCYTITYHGLESRWVFDKYIVDFGWNGNTAAEWKL